MLVVCGGGSLKIALINGGAAINKTIAPWTIPRTSGEIPTT
jgi:hypothetical protein